MSQAISTNFAQVLSDSTRKHRFRVVLKRRLFGTDTIEATGLTFLENEIKGISTITRKFDTRFQNRILASNITLQMRNESWKWVETNTTTGIWAPDAASVTGYDPFRSVIEVQAALRLDDETFEYLTLFTGLTVDYNFNTGEKVVQVTVFGNELKLITADAQRVSTQFTDEPTVPAVGDGIEDTFAMKVSVWEASEIRKAAATALQGKDQDFQLSSMNDADNTANIVFNASKEPGIGEAVDFTGRQWLRDQRISTLVGLICDEAGIGVGDRSITEPEFPSTVQSVSLNSQADFEAGLTLQNIDTKRTADSFYAPWIFVDDFEDSGLTGWGVVVGGGFSNVSNKMQGTESSINAPNLIE